jgi:hypothetical protein
VFDSLRLSVVVTAEALADVATDVAADVAADVLAVEVASELIAELNAEINAEIAGGTKLKVLLIAIHCWNSLESYTSFGT